MIPPPGLFTHVGRLRYLTANGRLLETEESHGFFDALREGVDFARRVVDVVRDFHIGNMATWPVPIEGLADHAPVYYANETWNLLVRANAPLRKAESA
jgi:hypothetical protein